ncbi:hypothetical protein GCM10011332_21260 [Terasakiella brassicae]|uniref:Uncharacterized protein n=1 Tax=Terasakiella brassicae TaxID=1634917 RepID=A0A917C143_9PROT|nr:hypothetical protein GCM10011332_21260 [Terasakiella brassicae]
MEIVIVLIFLNCGYAYKRKYVIYAITGCLFLLRGLMDYRNHLGECPLSEVHKRLDRVHSHWHTAIENYFEPEKFLAAAQDCIQTL